LLETPCAAVNQRNGAKETRTPDPLHAMQETAKLKCTAGEGVSLIAHSWLYQIYTPGMGQRYQPLEGAQPPKAEKRAVSGQTLVTFATFDLR